MVSEVIHQKNYQRLITELSRLSSPSKTSFTKDHLGALNTIFTTTDPIFLGL